MEMPLKHNGLNRSLWNDTFKEQTSFDPDSSAGSSLRKVCMSETVTAQSRMVVSVSLRVRCRTATENRLERKDKGVPSL